MQLVVEDVVRPLECIQVPVDVLRQHDRCLLRRLRKDGRAENATVLYGVSYLASRSVI